jgi:uncharacterized linocin/CFP29 family protein
MDNLHRDLAPVSTQAWAQIEDEAKRTFALNVAGRRLVDVSGPAGSTLAAVSTGHLEAIGSPGAGLSARRRQAVHLVELTAPFTVTRDAVDDVDRGSNDSDWQPVKDAARAIALAEDRAVFDGWPEAGIVGVRQGSSNRSLTLPADVTDYRATVSNALAALRLAGVDGPYALLLGADAYTLVDETSDRGYPLLTHLSDLVGDDGKIVWAPALSGGALMSLRGGDYQLHLGQDLSIGYTSHDDEHVRLYLRETFTFTAYTAEAAVALAAAG